MTGFPKERFMNEFAVICPVHPPATGKPKKGYDLDTLATDIIGFADATEKKSEYFWRNNDLTPDARPKGGIK